MRNQKFLSTYTLVLLLITITIGFFPRYNWDMLPYMALIQKMDGVKDFKQIHNTVYITADKNVPKNQYKDLVDSTEPYRVKMQNNAAAFESQLPFFDIKPVYLLLAYTFYKLGVTLSYATVLPSVIAFFFINFVSFFWIRKFNFSTVKSCVILFLICVLTIPLAIRSNPDTLACLFLLLSSYLFIETDNLLYSVVCLLLAILTRPENIIFAFLLLSIVLTGKWNKKVPLITTAICFLILAVAYFVPVKMMNYPGWSSLFYHAFIDNTVDPSIKQTITVAEYLKVVHENILNEYGITGLICLLILCFILVKKRSTNNKLLLYKLFFLVVVIWTIVKTLLFPMPTYRFFIPPALFIFFVIIKEYQVRLAEKNKRVSI